MLLSSRAAGWLYAAATVGIWTAFIVIARASAHHTLTPFDLAFVRFSAAALVLLPWSAWRVRKGASGSSWLGVSPLPWRQSAVLGLTAGLAYSLAAYNGFFFAPVAHGATLMTGSLPLWTALLSLVFLGERPGRARLAGLLLIVAGGLTVGGPSLLRAFEGGSSVWIGDLLFVTAAIGWAAYTVYARHRRLDAVRATIALVTFCAVVYLPAYALLAWRGLVHSRLAEAPWGELLLQGLMQGVASLVVAGICFTRMVQHWGAVRSTMVTALVPALAALGAVLFLGEPLFWNLLAGLALVTAGIVVGVAGGGAALPARRGHPAEAAP